MLVVGSYPPVPVPGAPVTLAQVRREWAADRDVTVVSPRLSAAHLAVPVAGPLAGRRLDNVRRLTGADHLVLVVEDGFPVPAGPAPLQLATVALLEPALRRFGHVRIVRVGSPVIAAPAWERLRRVAAEVESAEGGPAAAGVTVLGPSEAPPGGLPARVAAAVARRALGSRAPAARAALVRARHGARAAARRALSRA